jgi:hypothetical protein
MLDRPAQEAGGGHPESHRSAETGDRSAETGDRSAETGDRSAETGGRERARSGMALTGAALLVTAGTNRKATSAASRDELAATG